MLFFCDQNKNTNLSWIFSWDRDPVQLLVHDRTIVLMTPFGCGSTIIWDNLELDQQL